MCPWGLVLVALRNVCGRDWQPATGQKKEEFMPIIALPFTVFSFVVFFFFFSLWYPSSLLRRDPFVIPTPRLLAFLTALTLTLCLNPPSSTQSVRFPSCQRDDQTRGPAPASEPAAICTCWRRPRGSGLPGEGGRAGIGCPHPARLLCAHSLTAFTTRLPEKPVRDRGVAPEIGKKI